MVKNAVAKGSYFQYPIGGGYYNSKFSWICLECGLVWFSRDQAQSCSNRGHISNYVIDHRTPGQVVPPGKMHVLVRKFESRGQYRLEDIPLTSIPRKSLFDIYKKELKGVPKSRSKKILIEILAEVKEKQFEIYTYGYYNNKEIAIHKINLQFDNLSDRFLNFYGDGSKLTEFLEKYKYSNQESLTNRINKKLVKYGQSKNNLIKNLNEEEDKQKVLGIAIHCDKVKKSVIASIVNFQTDYKNL